MSALGHKPTSAMTRGRQISGLHAQGQKEHRLRVRRGAGLPRAVLKQALV